MMVFMMAMPMMVVRIMKVVLISTSKAKMSTGMNVSSITSRTRQTKML